jgi:hypothetical protein
MLQFSDLRARWWKHSIRFTSLYIIVTILYIYIQYLGGMVCTLKYDNIMYRRNVQCRKSSSSSLPSPLIKVDSDIIGGRGGGVLFFVAQKPTAEPYHYYNTHNTHTNVPISHTGSPLFKYCERLGNEVVAPRTCSFREFRRRISVSSKKVRNPYDHYVRRWRNIFFFSIIASSVGGFH